MKGENGPGASAEDQIAFPMSDSLACINDLRPVVDGCAIFDHGLSLAPLAPAAPLVAAAQIEPQPLCLLAGAVDEGIDRLRAQGPQPWLRTALEPARYLFWRPAFRETQKHEPVQFIVLFEDGASLPALNVGSGSEARTVTAGGQSVTAQLSGWGDAQRPRASAMARRLFPAARKKAICSLSSYDRCA